MNEENLKAMFLFNRVTNYTPKQKFALLEKYGSVAEILAKRKEAEDVFGKPFKINGSLLLEQKEMKTVEKEFIFYEKNGIEILSISDERYPNLLKEIYDPPSVLFACGNLELLKNECPVAMVGSRRASNSSITLGYSVARELAGAGAVVVSGLARGIDFYAHKGALDGKGGTIAVLGNGIDVVYPRVHSAMYERIRREGLILTEFPLGTPPYKRNFPMRNRVISGLVLGVLVVEASDKSGALITAEYALDHGRELMAFPGRASSETAAGNNRLIKEGAHLVESAHDVFSVLGREYDERVERGSQFFSPLEQEILKVIGDDLVSIEEIEGATGRPVSKVASALMMLELKSVVVQYPGKFFSRMEKYGH
jgi:DNA processing protein